MKIPANAAAHYIFILSVKNHLIFPAQALIESSMRMRMILTPKMIS